MLSIGSASSLGVLACVSNTPKHQAESGSSRQHKRKFKGQKSKAVSHKKTSNERLCNFCKSPKTESNR